MDDASRCATPERIFNGDFLGFIYFMKAFLLIVVKGVLACYICYASLHKVEKRRQSVTLEVQ